MAALNRVKCSMQATSMQDDQAAVDAGAQEHVVAAGMSQDEFEGTHSR